MPEHTWQTIVEYPQNYFPTCSCVPIRVSVLKFSPFQHRGTHQTRTNKHGRSSVKLWCECLSSPRKFLCLPFALPPWRWHPLLECLFSRAEQPWYRQLLLSTPATRETGSQETHQRSWREGVNKKQARFLDRGGWGANDGVCVSRWSKAVRDEKSWQKTLAKTSLRAKRTRTYRNKTGLPTNDPSSW